jgi:hypothetical protein
MGSMQLAENGQHLLLRQNDRQAEGLFCTLDAVEPWQFTIENVLIQKEECTLRLILCRRRDVVDDRQVGQKSSTSVAPIVDGWRLP